MKASSIPLAYALMASVCCASACSSDVSQPASSTQTSTTESVTAASVTSSVNTATGSSMSSSVGGTGGAAGASSSVTSGGATASTTHSAATTEDTSSTVTGTNGSGNGSGGSVTSTGTGTDTGTGGGGQSGSELGTGEMMGSGSTDEQYETALVSRNDEPYVFITNGWGPGFDSHEISWEGTSFVIESMAGSSGANGEPASYPTVFCGRYSVMQVPECGLPASRDAITSLRTGWRWAPNGNEGEYNAAYDIWVGTGNQLQGYLMVWLRDPPSYQPAGSPNMQHQGVTVENVPGVWDIWDGTVNRLPIINWVRAEGSDTHEIEFDVMDFVRDAEARGLSIPGTQINAVAVGFEIWEGPIVGLESVDFYVQVE